MKGAFGFSRLATIVVLVFACQSKSNTSASNDPAEKPGTEGASKTVNTPPAKTADSEAVRTDKNVNPVPRSNTSKDKPNLDPSEYFFLPSMTTVYGPPRPPIHVTEDLGTSDLVNWKEIPTYYENGQGSRRSIPTPLDAALDVHSTNNRGMLVLEFAAAGEFDLILRKYMPPEYEYMGFMDTVGQDYAENTYSELREHLSSQVSAFAPEVGRYLEPMPTRQDRLIGNYRLTQWSFRYVTPSGEEKIGCFLMVMMENAWRLLDMECAPQPWDVQK